MATKKHNKRWKVRVLRRALNRTTSPIRGLHARRIYRAGWGDGRMGKVLSRIQHRGEGK